MDKQLQTAISFARGSDDKIRIYVQDNTSHIQFLEIELDYESFAKALTGLHGVHCKSKTNGLEYIGKKRITELRSVVCPLDTYDREIFRNWLKDNCQEEGWLLSTYLGSQTSIIYADGKTILNYSVSKYVEVE